MKYIFLSFLLLGVTSCSLQNPLDSWSNIPVSSSGVLSPSESGGVSIDTDSGAFVEDSSGDITIESTGANVLSGTHAKTVPSRSGSIVGTGTQTPDTEKDPEVQNITKEIDNIFSDIEKGGK